MAEAGYTYTLNWCIPYLVGQPYRLRHLRRALEHIMTSNKVWFTTPREICTYVDGLAL